MSNTKYESANSGWNWVMWNRINWISLVKWVGKMWLLKRELMVLKRLTPFPLFSSSMVNELAVVVKRVLIMLSSLDRRFDGGRGDLPFVFAVGVFFATNQIFDLFVV